MGTEILKSFSSLQSELEQAKSSLKGVDENIKRLIGRDPSEDKSRVRNVRTRNYSHENDEPPSKRRSGVSVFKRLSDRAMPESTTQKQMISKVIVTPKEVPSRLEALAAQSKDEKSKARNRRMFGALLGTLQKFQQEETKLKPKEEKRAQLEKKIEEHEIKEKQEIKKERQELFLNRRKKQAEIKVIELKMLRMKEYAYWEDKQKPRVNFLTTKAKPHIHFLPRKLNEASKEKLATNKIEIEKMIEKKKNKVLDELKQIEERMNKNFEKKPEEKDEENLNDSVDHDMANISQLDESMQEDISHNPEHSTIKESENPIESMEIENGSENVDKSNEDKTEAKEATKMDESTTNNLNEEHLESHVKNNNCSEEAI
ncbi:unnamed protein product [Brassicogethes aeneus]|uniref:Pinin n=1 Tax=Brassicogethes aeneus TaxID=1431903 RepID=A0A9P0FEV1_BRAAE|nr:unnamed protein product [Brassicogethes aeneus]